MRAAQPSGKGNLVGCQVSVTGLGIGRVMGTQRRRLPGSKTKHIILFGGETRELVLATGSNGGVEYSVLEETDINYHRLATARRPSASGSSQTSQASWDDPLGMRSSQRRKGTVKIESAQQSAGSFVLSEQQGVPRGFDYSVPTSEIDPEFDVTTGDPMNNRARILHGQPAVFATAADYTRFKALRSSKHIGALLEQLDSRTFNEPGFYSPGSFATTGSSSEVSRPGGIGDPLVDNSHMSSYVEDPYHRTPLPASASHVD